MTYDINSFSVYTVISLPFPVLLRICMEYRGLLVSPWVDIRNRIAGDKMCYYWLSTCIMI